MILIEAFKWSRQPVAQQYDEIGLEQYDRFARQLSSRAGYARKLASICVQHTLDQGLDLEILEIGAGTGIITQALIEDTAGSVTPTDPSEHAVKFLSNRGIKGVIQTRAEDLPFTDKQFQLIVGVGFFRYILPENISKFIEGAYSQLPSLGILVVGEFFPKLIMPKGPKVVDYLDLFDQFFELRQVERTNSHLVSAPSISTGHYLTSTFLKNDK